MIWTIIYAYLQVAKSATTTSQEFLMITIATTFLVVMIFAALSVVLLKDYRKSKNKHIFYCVPFDAIHDTLRESAIMVTGGSPDTARKSARQFTMTMKGVGEIIAERIHYGKALVEFRIPESDLRAKYFLKVRENLLKRINDSSASIRFD